MTASKRIGNMRRGMGGGARGGTRGQRVPLSDARYRVWRGGLLALARSTPWGTRVEYVDLSLKRPVYVEYPDESR